MGGQISLDDFANAGLSRRTFVRSVAGTAGALGLGVRNATAQTDKVKIVWSTFGTLNELTRFTDFNTEFMTRHPDVESEFVAVPSYAEYHSKILTQLGAGQGPDVFYVSDEYIGRFVDSGQLLDLTDLLSGPDSQSQPDDFFEGLWGGAKTPEGRIFGVTNDCNPMVLWFNKPALAAAGIEDDPLALRDAGDWTWDAFTAMTDKLREAGKHGAVFYNSFLNNYSLIRANGGQVYDESGKFVASQDPKSVEALRFIYDNIKSKNFTYANALAQGQGPDALFISGQAGFESAGRWLLPTLKDTLPPDEYDIVTWPTTTGNATEPGAVATSFLVINANTPHPAEAFQFLTEFVSKDGQIFRLQGGGNAVPSIKGADEVVLEDEVPAHAQIFLEVRENGFVLPAEETRVPGLPQDILKGLEPLWLGEGDFEATVESLGQMVNERLAEEAG
jgi:multiple sugar transport system substrate-binding protein